LTDHVSNPPVYAVVGHRARIVGDHGIHDRLTRRLSFRLETDCLRRLMIGPPWFQAFSACHAVSPPCASPRTVPRWNWPEPSTASVHHLCDKYFLVCARGIDCANSRDQRPPCRSRMLRLRFRIVVIDGGAYPVYAPSLPLALVAAVSSRRSPLWPRRRPTTLMRLERQFFDEVPQ
jgi:hypothetical protein